jgi:hypothetical protein
MKKGVSIIREEKENEPTIAPSVNNHEELEEHAVRQEIEDGDSTSVTQLVLDRTPGK